MSGMAEVLRQAMRDHRVLWEIGLDEDCEIVAKCESCGYLGTELETWEHQSNVAAETLSAAGFGPVKEAIAKDLEDGADALGEGVPIYASNLRARAAAVRGEA